MTPDTGQMISLASIILPLVALVVFEIGLGSPGPVRSYYARFATLGCAHGFVLWVLFVWGNWHGLPGGCTESIMSLGLFLVGAVGVCLTFSAGYLGSALVLEGSRRFVRRARRTKRGR